MREYIITCKDEQRPDGSYAVEDYRELVRCKDCKHCEMRKTANYSPFYYCLRIDFSVKDNDYCSYGERKEQKDE